jgi:hypothetical protein
MSEIPRPRGICSACYQIAVAAMGNAIAGEIAGYCQHRQTGAIYQIALGRWITFEPIEHAVFLTKISSAEATAIARSYRGAWLSGSLYSWVPVSNDCVRVIGPAVYLQT